MGSFAVATVLRSLEHEFRPSLFAIFPCSRWPIVYRLPDATQMTIHGKTAYLACTFLPSTKATGPVYLWRATNTKCSRAPIKTLTKMTEAQLKPDAVTG